MLKLHNVTITYSDKTKAIDNVDLVIREGENIALIGENGSGKTTLLLAISGVLEAASGTIEIDSIQLTKKTINEIRKRIGLVFQNPEDQLFMPSVFDDIAFGCRNFGLPEAASVNHAENMIAARVDETLAQLNISHLRNRSSLKLSNGEKRMAAIATVLALEPSILMFDEPSAFLDHKGRRILIETLNKLHHTKIVTTHDLDFAAALCNRVIILKNGQIAADGTLDLLYDEDLMSKCDLEALRR